MVFELQLTGVVKGKEIVDDISFIEGRQSFERRVRRRNHVNGLGKSNTLVEDSPWKN